MRASICLLGFALVALGSCRDRSPTGPDAEPSYRLREVEWPLDLAAEPIDWLLANGYALSSLTSDDFSDLQFLEEIIGDRRLVQLGESGHGVAEFSEAKVRLIRFLHEEMGFDVVAFESPLYECHTADRAVDSISAVELVDRCLWGVWSVDEVRPLFEYVQATRRTARPLSSAGFDIQSKRSASLLLRPFFLKEVVGKLDPEYALDVQRGDEAGLTAYLGRRKDDLRALEPFYLDLLQFLDDHLEELAGFYPPPSTVPLIARQTVWSALQEIDHVISGNPEVRDQGMARNVAFLAGRVYPGHKIVLWAHNGHIRYANRRVHLTRAPWYTLPFTMGEEIHSHFYYRDGVYTLGLYMYEGQATRNDRTVYEILPAEPNSLEGYLHRAGEPYLFVDFGNGHPERAPEWVGREVQARSWGTDWLTLVPAEQYDGVLFIRGVRAPRYLPRTDPP